MTLYNRPMVICDLLKETQSASYAWSMQPMGHCSSLLPHTTWPAQLHFNLLFFCVLTKSLRILACLHTQKNGNISEHFRTQVKELSELV